MLAVAAGRADISGPDLFDLRALPCSALVLRDPHGIERVLLHDGLRRLRFDVLAGSVLDGPCRLRYDLAGYNEVAAKLRTVQRLLSLKRLGRFPRRLFPPDPRARRWMRVLQAVDAREDGATHREIAAALYGDDTVEADWQGRSTYLRCRVQRALRVGHMQVWGGYRRLLR